MSVSSYAYTLFWPSVIIIAMGILVLFIAWSSDAIGSRKQARVLETFRAAMRKSVPPAPAPARAPTVNFLPPLPVANPPPNSIPIPIGQRRSRLPLRPPPLPAKPAFSVEVHFDEVDESCITARYSQEELERLTRIG